MGEIDIDEDENFDLPDVGDIEEADPSTSLEEPQIEALTDEDLQAEFESSVADEELLSEAEASDSFAIDDSDTEDLQQLDGVELAEGAPDLPELDEAELPEYNEEDAIADAFSDVSLSLIHI